MGWVGTPAGHVMPQNTVWQAGGTHPTGMHSCSIKYWRRLVPLWFARNTGAPEYHTGKLLKKKLILYFILKVDNFILHDIWYVHIIHSELPWDVLCCRCVCHLNEHNVVVISSLQSYWWDLLTVLLISLSGKLVSRCRSCWRCTTVWLDICPIVPQFGYVDIAGCTCCSCVNVFVLICPRESALEDNFVVDSVP